MDFEWASADAYACSLLNMTINIIGLSQYPMLSNGKAIGVAVSTSPMGPFEDAIGEPLVTHDVLPVSKSEKANLDPSVLIDDDGKAYIFWGNGICYFAGLSESLTNIKARYTQSIFLILRKEVIFINAMDGITFLMAMIYLRR